MSLSSQAVRPLESTVAISDALRVVVRVHLIETVEVVVVVDLVAADGLPRLSDLLFEVSFLSHQCGKYSHRKVVYLQ